MWKVGEISWKLLHDTYEKDCTLQANLSKVPRLNLKVLHPGNNKQPSISISHYS